MLSLTVRNIDESIINALKERAELHHRSTEAEHRAVLMEALMKPKRKSFAEALLAVPNVGVFSFPRAAWECSLNAPR